MFNVVYYSLLQFTVYYTIVYCVILYCGVLCLMWYTIVYYGNMSVVQELSRSTEPRCLKSGRGYLAVIQRQFR